MSLGFADVERGKKVELDQLPKMRSELVADDVRPKRENFQAAKPFATNVVVSLLEHQPAAIDAGVVVREVIEASHVKCLPNCPELLDQCMIETGEMFVLQRTHNGLGKGDRAGLDRVALKLSALDEDLRKGCERVLDEPAARLFEMRLDESIMNLMQRTRKLFAVAAAPLFATDEPADLATREMDFVTNRPSVVGMFFDQCNKNFVSEWSGLTEFRIRSNDDVLFYCPSIEFDLIGSHPRRFLIVAKQRARDSQ